MQKAVLLVFALALGLPALAQPSRCPQHFNQGEAPEVTNPKLAAKTRPLCFIGYAMLHSGISRTAVWSAEYLTALRLASSKTVKRQNAFHAEDELPESERSELRDYARSGFDRGHMSPSGDMPDASAQYESFSLANIVPQDPKNNQRLWSAVEESTRKLARERGALYVITGPLFEGDALRRLNARVLIPSHVFKAIYDPKSGTAAAYLAPNDDTLEYRIVNIAELEQRSGLNLFPKMDARTKQAGMSLPTPRFGGRKPR